MSYMSLTFGSGAGSSGGMRVPSITVTNEILVAQKIGIT
jgi:hypothetical protein